MTYFSSQPMNPSVVFSVWITFSILCHGLQVEMNLKSNENSPERKSKFLCVSIPRKLQASKRKQNNRTFNPQERYKRTPDMHSEISLPSMMVKSSKDIRCFLVSQGSKSSNFSKKRFYRQLSNNTSAWIPNETGNCPPGYRIDQDKCYPCFPGSYTSGQETECFLCPKDFYIDKEAADSCWPCPEGKKTLAEGADSVDSCINQDVAGRVDESLSTKWIIILVLLLIFILVSWILIIVLCNRFYFSKQRRNVEGKERQINYSENEIQAIINENQKLRKDNATKENERSRTTSDSKLKPTQNEAASQTARKLENIREEVDLKSDTDDPCFVLFNKNNKNNKNPKGVFSISSPAKNNYFFITPAPESKSSDSEMTDEIIRKDEHLTTLSRGSTNDDGSLLRFTGISSLASDDSLQYRKSILVEMVQQPIPEEQKKTDLLTNEIPVIVSINTHNQTNEPQEKHYVKQPDLSFRETGHISYQIPKSDTSHSNSGKIKSNEQIKKTPTANPYSSDKAIKRGTPNADSQYSNYDPFYLETKRNEKIETANSFLSENSIDLNRKLILNCKTKKTWSLTSYPMIYTPKFEDNRLLDFDSSFLTEIEMEPDFNSSIQATENNSQISNDEEDVRIIVESDVIFPRYTRENIRTSQNFFPSTSQTNSVENICQPKGVSYNTVDLSLDINE